MAGMIYVHEDGDLARDRVRARLANRAHHNFRFTYETVPPGELDGVKRFMAGFDISKPLEERADPALSKPLEERADPALITDYLLRRFAIAGTPRECAARIRELAEAGVSHVLLTPPTACVRRGHGSLGTRGHPGLRRRRLGKSSEQWRDALRLRYATLRTNGGGYYGGGYSVRPERSVAESKGDKLRTGVAERSRKRNNRHRSS